MSVEDSGASPEPGSFIPDLPPLKDNELEFSVPNAGTFERDQIICSSPVTVGRFRFHLKVCPKKNDETVGAFIVADAPQALRSHVEFENVTFSITLFNWKSNGHLVRQSRSGGRTFKGSSEWGWSNFVSVSKVQTDGWVGPGDTLHFRASVTAPFSDESWENEMKDVAFANLGVDFLALLSSGWKADMLLRAGGEEMQVHSLILGARSPVFKCMFENSMREQSSSAVEITDISIDTLRTLCRYIYTGHITERCTERAIQDLLRAASKYEIVCLEHLCAIKLERGITVQSAADLLILAAQVNAEQLRSKCLKFVVDNLSEVQCTEGWTRLMQDKQLLTEVAPALFKIISPPPAKMARTQ